MESETGSSISESDPQFIGEGTDPDISEDEYGDVEVYRIDDPVRFLEVERNDRKHKANLFRMFYAVGGSCEKKTCIWSDGDFSCRDKSTGIMWVGVHGMDSICAVTKAGALDVARVQGGFVYETMERALLKFRISVISEMEDLADPLSKLRKIDGRSIEKPFGVVSGIPCIGQEASSDDEFEQNRENVLIGKCYKSSCIGAYGYCPESESESVIMKPSWCDEEKTIKFLQEKRKAALLTNSETTQASSVEYDDTESIEFLKYKMKSKTDFTMEETIQTAICAFQRLFQTKFNASDIEVSVADLGFYPEDDKDSVQNLELSEIEHHLAVINWPNELTSQAAVAQQ